jgi:hypothetical protein
VYVPALYWRQAEMLALDGLDYESNLIAPLLTLKAPGVIDPPDPEGKGEARFLEARFEDAAATRSRNAYIDRVAEQVGQIAFGVGRLDLKHPLPFVYADTAHVDAAMGWSQLERLVSRVDGPVVPVWRSRTPRTEEHPSVPTSEAALREAIRLGADGRGLAARVVLGNIVTKSALPSALRQAAPSVDLILDLGADVAEMSRTPGRPSWFEAFSRFVESEPWRRVILLSGGFPRSLHRHKTFEIQRSCRKMYAAFAQFHTGRHVIPGDYGCVFPELIEKHGGSHNPNIRYASSETWVIHRAAPAPPSEPSPYWELSRTCVDHPTFKSVTYSVGDEAIYATSQGLRAPGWAKSGLARSLSHHLRLATLEAELES